MSSSQYGIGVTKNRFELFDIEGDDPLEVLKIHEQEREAKKKTKLSEKENKGKEPAVKAKSTTAQLQRKGIKETQNLKPQDGQKGKEDTKTRVPRVERGERKFTPDNREDRKNKEERPQSDFQREERGERIERKEFKADRAVPAYGESVVDSRGRGRGARGGFTPRGGRGAARGGPRPGFDARGKREYDRQSGSDKTGVKPVDKREGSGAHNWGNHRDDLEDINNQIAQPQDENTWAPEKEKVETDVAAPELNNGAPETEEGVTNALEEEKKELTLDEWKALKAPRQKPTYNLRKAGEGEDPSQWKKMYALQKKKDGDDDDDEDEYEYENCEYPQRVGRQKHVLDIDIHFKDTRGAGRGRGGRGAGRGGPRMPIRGNIPNPVQEKAPLPARDSSQKIAPKVDDEHDFPSLG